MERNEAIAKLKLLVGTDLVKLAARHDVTVWKAGKLNKGWAGHAIERYLGLPLNSAQAPNFGSWELKIVPLKHLRSGEIVIKETMAITMIDPVNVAETSFERSHLLTKMRRAVICARLFVSKQEKTSLLNSVSAFNLDDPAIYAQVKKDYDLVRQTIQKKGFRALTGRMGVFVQPRTKGPGHGSTSRAFYARKVFLKVILNL